jgi:hypothetical protein
MLAAVTVAAWFICRRNRRWKRCGPSGRSFASIEDLSKSGGRLTHTLCGDPKRFCVLIPAHPMTCNTDNKEAVYVVPVGY